MRLALVALVALVSASCSIGCDLALSASLMVNVKDAAGNALEEVQLRAVKGAEVHDDWPEQQGAFSIGEGTWRIEATKAGFVPAAVDGVTIGPADECGDHPGVAPVTITLQRE